MRVAVLIVLTIALLISCKSKYAHYEKPEGDVTARAERLAQQNIITDGHVDLPYRLKVRNFRLEREFLGIPIETDEGDFDFVRAREGGLDAPFMSIYLPSAKQSESGASKKLADTLINMVEGIAQAHPDKFVVAHTPEDCHQAHQQGKVALPMGMENGSGIEDDLSLIHI